MDFYSDVRQHEIWTLDSVRHLLGYEEAEMRTLLMFIRDTLWDLEGMYVFETMSGRVGLSSRPLTQADSIYLVPFSDRLHAMSTETHQYGGCVWVQGLVGDSLLSTPEDLEPRWEDITLK